MCDQALGLDDKVGRHQRAMVTSKVKRAATEAEAEKLLLAHYCKDFAAAMQKTSPTTRWDPEVQQSLAQVLFDLVLLVHSVSADPTEVTVTTAANTANLCTSCSLTCSNCAV